MGYIKMTNQEIVSKLWNLCNILRDDGITYHQYVTELTYILFLKMAKETKTEDTIPEEYRWDKLVTHSGIELKKFYKELLAYLGENTKGRVREIYQGSSSNIDEPKNLEKIIKSINELDWYSAKEEGLGNLYEGLLEKNANEKKSGAGQYFTPRVLIDVMTQLIAPQVGERCNDPACGTFGFMIAADAYVKSISDDYCDLTEKQAEFQVKEAFSGGELVHETHRLALMNAMLHNIEGRIVLGDTLSESGKARAAVVLPDNVLFADGDGEKIRVDLMNKCNLHTVLRLPTGIFYARGVKTNVLFFTRGKNDKDNTKAVWFYDLRTNMPSFGKTNQLKKEHFADFIKAYEASDRTKIKNERWNCFTRDQIAAKGNSLDLGLIRDESILDYENLPNPIESAQDCIDQLEMAADLIKEVVRELQKTEK